MVFGQVLTETMDARKVLGGNDHLATTNHLFGGGTRTREQRWGMELCVSWRRPPATSTTVTEWGSGQ
jgi:hypothetical protein